MEEAEEKKNNPTKKNSGTFIVIFIVLSLTVVFYRLLVLKNLEQSSLLFIGIPFILAIALTLTPRPKSVTGIIMKSITLLLLFFGVSLIEGFICILIVSPLFYLVGGVIGLFADSIRKNTRLNCSLAGVLLIMSLEGVTETLSFSRDERVVIEKEFNIPTKEAWNALEKGPDFNLKELPPFLKLGFPTPQAISGSGIEIGDEWQISFNGRKGKLGDLTVKVIAKDSTQVTYQCVKDESHLVNWLVWKTIRWEVTETGQNMSKVKMVLEYDRMLDPAWYFKPIERYGVRLAGEYFIDQMISNSVK